MKFEFTPLGKYSLFCENESGHWYISQLQANFATAKYKLPYPDGENYASMIKDHKFDFSNDDDIKLRAHAMPQEDMLVTPTVEQMIRLIPRVVANDDGGRDWVDVLLENGFVREENYANLGIPCYKLDIKKGIITVHDRWGFDMTYEGKSSFSWWSFFRAFTIDVHDDGSTHPKYFPPSTTNINGVMAKFMIEEIIPWVRVTRITNNVAKHVNY